LKKTALHAALFALTLPITLHAIGLGEMTIKSSIDQPFFAEIELLDVGSAPIVGIKVGVADPENFQQIGLERIAALSLLHFNIEKNAKGKLVIKVISMERMTEPYMELVVDLIWPNGQLYKAYTVLLDPPGYQLVSTRAHSSPTYYKKVTSNTTAHNNEPGVINKAVITEVQNHRPNLGDGKKKTTYGPTITNENVWQIAQRYKTSETILPQVVLAIVGMNPDAFKDGNLNGLKVGIRLTIPATQEILQVPADLATEEVMAHDKAWNDKSPINHVLSPPYMNGQVTNPPPQVNALPVSTSNPGKNSKIPTIPIFSVETITPVPGAASKLISNNPVVPVVNNNKLVPDQNNKQQNSQQDSNMKAEISITTAAVESVRESNALLMEQLHLLQDHNKKLQQQIDKRDKEMALIQSQMKSIMKSRQAVAPQANAQSNNNNSSNLWPLMLLLIVAAGGGGFAYWYFKRRGEENNDEPYLSGTNNEPKADPFITPIKPDSRKNDEKAMLPVITAAIAGSDSSEQKETPAQTSEDISGHDKSSKSVTETKNPAEGVKIKAAKKHSSMKEHDDSHVVITPEDVDIQDMSEENQSNPVHIESKIKEETAKEQTKEPDIAFKSLTVQVPHEAVQIQHDANEKAAKNQPEQESEAPPIEFKSAPIQDVPHDAVQITHDIINEEAVKEQPEEEAEAPAIEFESAAEHKVKQNTVQIQPAMDEEIDKESLDNEHEPEAPAIEFESINVNELKNDTEQAKIASKKIAQNEEDKDEESPALDLLEFESGLHHLLPEQSLKDKAKAKQAEIDDDEETEVEEKRGDNSSDLSPAQNVVENSSSEASHQILDKPLDLGLDLNLELDSISPEVVEEDTDQNLESDLDPEITEFFAEPEPKSESEPELEPVPEKKPKLEQITDENNITYRSPLQELSKLDSDDALTANPLKSKAALNTLLALAKTYIGMDDIEAATSSLEEVLEFGSESQKAEAQGLLDEIKNK